MDSEQPFQAGYLQFEPLLGNLKSNMRTINDLMEACQGADLIVLPELCNSGYHFESKEQAKMLAEEIEKSIFIDFLIFQASKYKIFIVSGFNELEADKQYNSAVLIGPKGFIGKYRKMHLFMNEWDFFEKGNLGLPVFDLGICQIGMLVCFDWVFPECWRILALKGADIICHPSNLVLPYAQQAIPVHGMINRTFNITANRIGTERGLKFTGNSIITDPFGKTLKTGSSNFQETGICNLNLAFARDKRITPRNHLFDDRLPGEYSSLCTWL